MKEKFSKLEKILKINIKKKNLLSEAFTHKSANQERNNEKYRELHRFCAFIGIFLALTTGFAGIGLLP